MASLANLLASLLLIAIFSPTPILCYLNQASVRVQQGATNTSAYHTYIVLVEPPPFNADEDMYHHWYESFLPSSRDGDLGKARLVHSYTKVFSGFATMLTDGELDVVAKKPGFVWAFKEKTRYLMTTRTPKFLGLRNGTGFWRDASYGKGVCNSVGCYDSDILAGLDAAIKDGVDVLSISIGLDDKFDKDPIAIGLFSAMSKGIVVVCSGGNEGPEPHSIKNDAPWLITVVAGSVDRSFDVGVNLGNGMSLHGEALNQVAKPMSKMYPLLYSEAQRDCNYMVNHAVAQKIVVCDSEAPWFVDSILQAGAAGVVLDNKASDGYTVSLDDDNSGVVQMSARDGAVLRAYAASSSRSARASFSYHKTFLGYRPAPVVASFSSRGPSKHFPGVLKPDILAPGLNILAACPWTESKIGPFNILSGTSMAAPHISGVAALIKSLHPDWSPAAVKSADDDCKHGKADAYAMGAGHVNPTRAADPGLVYDLGVTDYAGYICWLLGDRGLTTIVRNKSLTCAKLPKVRDVELNYPTITVPLKPTAFMVNRTVTNVGPPSLTYVAKLDMPKSLTVRVTPNKLVFSKAREKKSSSGQFRAVQPDHTPGSQLSDDYYDILLYIPLIDSPTTILVLLYDCTGPGTLR
uniref:Subtilisin-like protease n=1 Tax=Aegilops tauschii TaxID=37682 RepID=M8C3F0_AEGTA